jgi:DNA-binding transcriptional regulator YhcF (GntR family)
MDIFIDRNSPVPPYLQIKERIKDFISNGEYKENQSVTSIREISRITGISLATVQKAYRELKHDKCIYAKAGAGYFVSRQSSLSNTVFVLLPNSRLSFYTYILDGMFEANTNNESRVFHGRVSGDKKEREIHIRHEGQGEAVQRARKNPGDAGSVTEIQAR